MTWLEIIDIRFNQNDAETLLRQYIFPLLEAEKNSALTGAGVFRKSTYASETAYNSCFQVLLTWPESLHAGKTKLGLLLVKSLEGFGLIEHTVWESCFLEELAKPREKGNQKQDRPFPILMHEIE